MGVRARLGQARRLQLRDFRCVREICDRVCSVVLDSL